MALNDSIGISMANTYFSNPINQQIALKTIKKLGFPVKAVWNGKEALDYLAAPSEEQPRPDIILMDVQMPIMGKLIFP
jgi:CheY-like chemotaxis protein